MSTEAREATPAEGEAEVVDEGELARLVAERNGCSNPLRSPRVQWRVLVMGLFFGVAVGGSAEGLTGQPAPAEAAPWLTPEVHCARARDSWMVPGDEPGACTAVVHARRGRLATVRLSAATGVCLLDYLMVVEVREGRWRSLAKFEVCDSGGSVNFAERWAGLRQLAPGVVLAEVESDVWFHYSADPTASHHRARQAFVCVDDGIEPRCEGPIATAASVEVSPNGVPGSALGETWAEDPLVPGEGDVEVRSTVRLAGPGLLRMDLTRGTWSELQAELRSAAPLAADVPGPRFLRFSPDPVAPTALHTQFEVQGEDPGHGDYLDTPGPVHEVCARFVTGPARCAVQRLTGPWAALLIQAGDRRVGFLGRREGRQTLRPLARFVDEAAPEETPRPTRFRGRRRLGRGYEGFLLEEPRALGAAVRMLVWDARLERVVAMVPVVAESAPLLGTPGWVERSEATPRVLHDRLSLRLRAGTWRHLLDNPELTLAPDAPYELELPRRP